MPSYLIILLIALSIIGFVVYKIKTRPKFEIFSYSDAKLVAKTLGVPLGSLVFLDQEFKAQGAKKAKLSVDPQTRHLEISFLTDPVAEKFDLKIQDIQD